MGVILGGQCGAVGLHREDSVGRWVFRAQCEAEGLQREDNVGIFIVGVEEWRSLVRSRRVDGSECEARSE